MGRCRQSLDGGLAGYGWRGRGRGRRTAAPGATPGSDPLDRLARPGSAGDGPVPVIATQARRAFSLATVLMLLLLPIQPAHAYVRAVTELGVPVWWRSPCIAMDIYLGSPPPTLTADQYWDASLLAAQA